MGDVSERLQSEGRRIQDDYKSRLEARASEIESEIKRAQTQQIVEEIAKKQDRSFPPKQVKQKSARSKSDEDYAREEQAQQAHPKAEVSEDDGGTEPVESTYKTKLGNDRKGDPTLLDGKDRVTFRTAEQYLGIGERQRQNLIKFGALRCEGLGQNRQITTESLRKYLPPENPK